MMRRPSWLMSVTVGTLFLMAMAVPMIRWASQGNMKPFMAIMIAWLGMSHVTLTIYSKWPNAKTVCYLILTLAPIVIWIGHATGLLVEVLLVGAMYTWVVAVVLCQRRLTGQRLQ